MKYSNPLCSLSLGCAFAALLLQVISQCFNSSTSYNELKIASNCTVFCSFHLKRRGKDLLVDFLQQFSLD